MEPGRADSQIDFTGGSVTAERAAAVFKALADPLRIQLVAMTRGAPEGSVCFCDLAAQLDMPQSSLSHHLRVLVDAGILERERRGTWSWYSLRDEPFEMLEDALRPGGVIAPSRSSGTHTVRSLPHRADGEAREPRPRSA